MLDHISKDIDARQKYSAVLVFGNVVKHGLSCLIIRISLETNVKKVRKIKSLILSTTAKITTKSNSLNYGILFDLMYSARRLSVG